MIPRVAHFVYGLREQVEPFHFLHYAALESCHRTIEPDTIYLHHKHEPWGPWWERIRPRLTLMPVELVPEVTAADYSRGLVPEIYRYAHHGDFIRLDVLLAHGGIYADIDTIFVRPFPDELFAAPFVIGREPDVRDELSGEWRPSLCNALLLSEPGAAFARAWREAMAAALNGSWSNHSGFLSEQLSRRMPADVRVEPATTFFPFIGSPAGLARLLEQRVAVPAQAVSVHLWAHLWWERSRRDLSAAHAGRYVPSFVRWAPTTLADLVRPYLPDRPAARSRGPSAVARRPSSHDDGASSAAWSYLSLDESSGYGVAAERCIEALERSGLALTWTPFVPGPALGLGYEPSFELARGGAGQVVVAHLVAEYLTHVRARQPDAFLVAHTVWDTTRIPDHWVDCLDLADLIVVPSRFSADAIENSAAAPPVAIVPHVAPASLTPSAGPPAIAEETVVFYTVAEWNERKAVFLTIEAYLRAFSGRDDVLLVVKTSHYDRRLPHVQASTAGPGTTPWALARLLASHEHPPAVRLVTRELAYEQIAGLHGRGDCFVSLARCEGWGLGAFDAAAHGNPVVTTGFGGQLDYLGGSPHIVRYELIPVENPAGFPSYAPDQRWAEPDLDHAAALMREVAADLPRARALSEPRAADIRRRYDAAAVAAAFRAAVQDAR